MIGPALMFTLAWVFLPDLPEYRTGMIIVGLAPCIAMVIIWNDLALGDREAAAVLVAINSVIQVLIFAVLAWFYLSVLPGWLGMNQTALNISTWQIAKSVLIFLGIPLVAGYLTRRYGEKAKGRDWYESTFLPRIGPWALYGLLFTIVILFALQGKQITYRPFDVVRIALPLLAYFAIMWSGGFLVGAALGAGVPAHHHAGIHLRRQQLRTSHCRRHRDLRRYLRTGAGRGGRPADRGTRSRQPGLCLTGPTSTLCPAERTLSRSPQCLLVP